MLQSFQVTYLFICYCVKLYTEYSTQMHPESYKYVDYMQ